MAKSLVCSLLFFNEHKGSGDPLWVAYLCAAFQLCFFPCWFCTASRCEVSLIIGKLVFNEPIKTRNNDARYIHCSIVVVC